MANDMENWRLSRIEEELERLDIAYPDAEIPEGFRDSPNSKTPTLSVCIESGPTRTAPDGREQDMFNLSGGQELPDTVFYNRAPDGHEQEIYSKAVIYPGQNQASAIKKISDKYDSLGKINPAPFLTKQELSKMLADPEDLDDDEENGFGDPEILDEFITPEAPPDKPLSEQDIMQVEMFYRSHKSEVFVCQCVSQMYFGSAPKHSSMQIHLPENSDNWTAVKAGIPVLILDTGESRRDRRLSLVLAERGTGFMLWRDIVNHLTGYREVQPAFHAMHLSTDHTRMAAFQFDDAGAASDFLLRLSHLTSDPDDSILNLTGRSKKKKESKFKRKGKYKAPAKSDISSPCCFTHVTNIDRAEGVEIVGEKPPPHVVTTRLSPVKTPRVSSMIPDDT